MNARYLNPKAFQAFIRAHQEEWPLAFLSLQFPAGSAVVPQGLAGAQELNGKEGEVVQFARDRVGVQFAELPDRGSPPVAIFVDFQCTFAEALDPPSRSCPGTSVCCFQKEYFLLFYEQL